MLQIKVWDWDMFGMDTLIGWASLPLNGVFRIEGREAEGQIKSGLAVTYSKKEEVYAGKWETVQKIEPWGDTKGTVRIEVMPKYRQFGAPLKLKPGVQYMAVEIMSCANLPATDENGMTDCFVKAEWEGMVQQMRVLRHRHLLSRVPRPQEGDLV